MQNLLSSVSALTSIQILSLAFSFLRNLLIAKFVGSYEIGIAAGYSAVLAAVEACSELGIRNAIIQHAKGFEREFLGTVNAISLIRGMVIAVFLIGIGEPCANWFQVPTYAVWFQMIAIAPILRGLWNNGIVLEQRELRFTKIALVELFGQIAAIIISTFVAHYSESHSAIFVGIATHNCIMCIMSHVLSPISYVLCWSTEYLPDIRKFGTPLVIASTLMFVNTQADKFLIGRVTDIELLGQFSLAVMLTQVPLQAFSRVFKTVFLPILLKGMQEDNVEQTRVFAWRIAVLAVLLAVPSLGVVGPMFVRLTYGAEYNTAAAMLPTLSFACAGRLLQCVPSQISLAAGRTDLVARANLFRSALVPVQATVLVTTESIDSYLVSVVLAEFATLGYFTFRVTYLSNVIRGKHTLQDA